ncbi:MAG: hypothetical protein A2Y38_13200 [Spirochaetes bacterium GWB1_59_5]|nr:MAG: hypothetical protein A2Y38_13200 [Spirochaetes bacterium GWB1_59_5]
MIKAGRWGVEGKFYEWNFSKFWMGSKQIFNCPVLDDRVEWNIDSRDAKNALRSTSPARGQPCST